MESAGADIGSAVFESVGHSCSQPIFDINGNVNMDASRRVSFKFIINTEL